MRPTLAMACLLVLHAFAAPPPQSANQFIWISDVHFDPTANAGLTDALAAASVGDWARILDSAQGQQASKFGHDTDWPLLSAALADIRQTAPHAQFTVVTGDVFVHDLRSKFNATATRHDDQAFEEFAAKTFQFVAAQLQSLTPGKPVLFTLGNNDGDCGDYDLHPSGDFLKNTSAAVQAMLGPVADETSARDWSAAGTYNVQHPVLKKHRIISLSSVYFSPKYKDSCAPAGATAGDPAKDELTWLATQLSNAKAHNEKVWLIFHIAPGIDGYATSHPRGGGTAKPVVPMWKTKYTAVFEKLLAQYHDTVTVSLAGHEHMDDFRLIGHSLVLLAPGISPLVGQNPAFRLVSYKHNGELADASTYYLSNLDVFDNAQKPNWEAEYSFDQKWGMKLLDFQSFTKLFHQIESSPDMQSQWMTFYGVSHPQGNTITKETFPWLFCAAGNVTEEPFEGCVSGIQKRGSAVQ